MQTGMVIIRIAHLSSDEGSIKEWFDGQGAPSINPIRALNQSDIHMKMFICIPHFHWQWCFDGR
jgi:hypothetical protein